MEKPHKLVESDIELYALPKKLIAHRKWIIRITGGFIIMGVLVALLSPVSFTAGTTFVPQTSSNQPSSSLSGLASLAGINLGGLMGSSSEIPSNLYPNIVESVPYRLALLNTTLSESNQSFKTYALSQDAGPSFIGGLKKYTLGLRSLIFKSKQQNHDQANNPIFRITEEDKNLFNFLENTLSVEVNEKEGFVTLNVSLKDPVIAAEVAQAATALLQEKIIAYKNQSAVETLHFVQGQFDAKKNEFEQLQDSIARFKDQNLNIASSLYQNKLKRLEANFTIVSGVFQELAAQLEQAKLQVSKETPIFTVIEPVNIPLQRSKPKRTLIVIIWTFLGLVFSAGGVLVWEPAKTLYREVWVKENT